MNPVVASRAAEDLAPPSTLISETTDSVRRARETFPLALFRAVAERVPAYKDFLRRNKIAPEKIRTVKDLASVPPVDKKNYISQYPIERLCWDGRLGAERRLIFTSSSGSTGPAFYFPRDPSLEFRSALLFELSLVSMFRGKMPPTLFIVSFGMGVWIGGVISLQSLRFLGEKGYPISVITPGPNKKEVFEALKRLAPHYECVVLGGYPPFIKDILDEASEFGFNPSDSRLKLFCAAEAFSETFRDYVIQKAGAEDSFFDTTNLYGSADIGTMAIETPTSIALRRRALEDSSLYTKLFRDASKLPTFAQFHPAVVNFEEADGRLFVTGNNVLPLIRYDIGDRGGVREYDEVMRMAEDSSPETMRSVSGEGIPTPPLPFVYVYERVDFSASLYGILIHAEYVRNALQVKSIEDVVTGKFSMSTERDGNEDQFLDIHVEMKPGIASNDDMQREVRACIVEGLLKRSSEYLTLHDSLKDRVLPHVTLWPYGHPSHFSPGAKQQWVKKDKKS